MSQVKIFYADSVEMCRNQIADKNEKSNFKEVPYFVIAITYHVFAKEMMVVPRLGLSVVRYWWLSNMRNTWSLLF